MKAEDILEAIGNADDKSVKNAREKGNKKLWVYISSVAAVLVLAIIIPIYYIQPEKTSGEGEQEEIELEWGEVYIYYSDGGKIASEKQYLPLSSKDIFEAWRIKNGFGEEAKLYKFEIDNNGTTNYSEFSGICLENYTPGDYYIVNITVSKALENNKVIAVYDPTLDTLKMTMTGYLDFECDEYNVFFQ